MRPHLHPEDLDTEDKRRLEAEVIMDDGAAPAGVAHAGTTLVADAARRGSGNAALTLRDFCAWQRGLNEAGGQHPDRWDTAMLFTRHQGPSDVSC